MGLAKQNAALVEENAAAAESMRAQAQQLVQAVAVLKLTPKSAAAESAYAERRVLTVPKMWSGRILG